MVALYILCRVESFDFGRFFDLAPMDFLMRSGMSLFCFPENLKVRFVLSAFCVIYAGGDKILGGVPFGGKPRGYFKGWLRCAVNKKMSHPRKRIPGKHEILGFGLYGHCG